MKSGRGILLDSESQMTLSLMIRVTKLSDSGSIQGHYTRKIDLKLDSPRFLTLITILQSHLAFSKIPLPDEKRLNYNFKLNLHLNSFKRLTRRTQSCQNLVNWWQNLQKGKTTCQELQPQTTRYSALFFSLNNRKPLAWLPLVRKWSGKKFFKVREKSGNCASSQGKIKSLKEVRKSGVLKLRNSFPSLLLFPNVKNSLFHFTDMNFVTLVEYFSEKLNNKLIVSF